MILEIVGFLVWFWFVSWVVFCLVSLVTFVGEGGKSGVEWCGGDPGHDSRRNLGKKIHNK